MYPYCTVIGKMQGSDHHGLYVIAHWPTRKSMVGFEKKKGGEVGGGLNLPRFK